MWIPKYRIIIDGKTVRKETSLGKELSIETFKTEKKALAYAQELFDAANNDPDLRIEADSNTQLTVLKNAAV